jgi:hypothetical protein
MFKLLFGTAAPARWWGIVIDSKKDLELAVPAAVRTGRAIFSSA